MARYACFLHLLPWDCCFWAQAAKWCMLVCAAWTHLQASIEFILMQEASGNRDRMTDLWTAVTAVVSFYIRPQTRRTCQSGCTVAQADVTHPLAKVRFEWIEWVEPSKIQSISLRSSDERRESCFRAWKIQGGDIHESCLKSIFILFRSSPMLR